MIAKDSKDRTPFLLLSTLSIAVCIFGLAGDPIAAFAQQAPADSTSPSTAAAPKISPRGQRLAQEIKYGDWSKFCFKPGGAKMTCRTTINGNWETGQQAVRLDVIEREDEGAARLQLFLPVGLYLPAGVKLSVDQGTPYSIPYTWCLANTCIAANVAEPKMIRELEAGQKLVIEVVDTNILAVTTHLPLHQFGAVHHGAPSKIFEQMLDE